MTEIKPNILFTIANKNDLKSFVKFRDLYFVIKKLEQK